jgi:uncharacterized coiled-coil protein SlyX
MRSSPVAYRTDDSHAVDDDYEVDEEEEPRRGLLSWILIIALLAGTGSGSAVLWRTFGGGPILTSLTSTTTAVAAAEKPSGRGDLDLLRQEITGSVQSTQQLLAAQQAEIKRLAEQVSALSGKLEMLQRPVTSAQAAIPAPVPAPKAVVPAPKKKPEIAKPVAAKPSDADAKPAEAKPTNGPISTGGAPLQLSR